MCNEVVDDFLPVLKLVSDWFVISRMIKKLLTALYADENISYFKVLVMPYFLVIKLAFLVYILIILTLKILIIMKMILNPLFISNFWLGILNTKNAKH